MNKDPIPLIDPDDEADWEFDDDKWEAPKAARDELEFRDPRAIHTSLKPNPAWASATPAR